MTFEFRMKRHGETSAEVGEGFGSLRLCRVSGSLEGSMSCSCIDVSRITLSPHGNMMHQIY